MKSEETKYEETLYEDNQVTTSNEANENELVDVNEESKPQKSSVWRKAGVGMGMGVLLGSATSFVASETINANPDKPVKPITPEQNDEHPVWSDGKIEVATCVTDEMSFSEAFGAARAEVGTGGAFEWRGNVYSTYTAEEWDAMSAEERDAYNDHFNWNNHQATTSQTSTTISTTTQQATTEEPIKPEIGTSETIETSQETDNVEVNVQETTPEVEILGVMHDDETGANLGLMTVEEQEFVFVDIDDDGEFDVIVSDVNNDGDISENEVQDISNEHISVAQFENNSFGESSMYASTDGTTDYINDADSAYEA